MREVFSVEFPSGGADAILKYQVPVLLASPGHTLVLLDGDKQRIPQFIDPDTIPVTENDNLASKIKEATGVDPELTVDGGAQGGNAAQRIEAQRKYLAWIRKNVHFIPTSCPEELVLRAAGKADPAARTSQDHKLRLRELAVQLFGPATSSERTDVHGETLLADARAGSTPLAVLAERLRSYLGSVH